MLQCHPGICAPASEYFAFAADALYRAVFLLSYGIWKLPGVLLLLSWLPSPVPEVIFSDTKISARESPVAKDTVLCSRIFPGFPGNLSDSISEPLADGTIFPLLCTVFPL